MIQIRSRRHGVVKVVLLGIALFLLSVTWSNYGEAADPVRMRFAWPLTPGHPMTAPVKAWLKKLTEASKGTVIIDFHGAEALGKAPEYWELVEQGLADMALFSCSYNPAQFQMSTFVELPFFSTSSSTSYDVVKALLDKKLIASEFKPNKLLMHVMSPPSQIYSNKKIAKAGDFKGTRLMCMGPVWNKAMGLLGAQCVSMSMQDAYLALDRGTLDAAFSNWASVLGYKWVEVVKYPIDISIMGGFFSMFIMNEKSWGKLSPEVQAAWTEICAKTGPRFAAAFDGADKKGKKIWPAAGKKILVFPAAEKEKTAKILAPVWQDWIERMEKAGKPGKEIYRTYVEVLRGKGEPVFMKVPGLYKD